MGPNPSQNPDVDYTNLDAVLVLLQNEDKFLAEVRLHNAVYVYLLALKAWKDNEEQRIANGLSLQPPPIPPTGYVPPVIPKIADLPKPSYEPIVFPKTQFGQYPCGADINPAGTEIVWNGLHLIKVIWPTPFGNSQWWQEK